MGRMPGFLHLSSGDVFRGLDAGSALGQELSQYTSQGRLVPDELTMEICTKHIEKLGSEGQFDPENDFLLLDGLPRTYRQAELLDQAVQVERIYYLTLGSDEEAVARIKGRAAKEGRADDADESVIRERFRMFQQQTAATLEHYDRSLIVEINSSRRPMEILADLAASIAGLSAS